MRDEIARLAASQRPGVLDTEPDLELDELMMLLARVFDAESASVHLVDTDGQWFTASAGTTERRPAREVAFCDHTVRQSGTLVVEDARADQRFATHPLVTGDPFVRFCAGAALVTRDGAAVGAVCVFDGRARAATPHQQATLETVALQVVERLELRAAGRRAAEHVRRAAPGPEDLEAATHRDEQLRDLVLHGTTGYVEADVDGVVGFVNEAAARMLGYETWEMVGRPAADFAHPAHVADQAEALARLRTVGRDRYEATRIFCHRDGRPVQLRCSVSVRAPSGTRGGGTAALLTDQTGQVSAGTSRVLAEQARQRVLQTATDAFVSMDGDGVVLEWNAAAERLFGYTTREAVGASVVDLVIPADLHEAHRAAIGRLVLGGEPALVGHPLELPALHRDGRVVQIELTPWMDTLDDGTRRFHAFCRDDAARIAAREALLESNRLLQDREAHLRAAFDASPTADALLDDEGVFVRVNPAICSFLGASQDTLTGARLLDVVHGHDRTLVVSAWATVARGDRGVPRLEVRFLRGRAEDGERDGEGDGVVWGLTSLVPMGSGGGPRAMLRIEDLQAHKELQSAHALQASHDAVTGLPNRSLFVERVRQALAAQDDGPAVAVLVLDVQGLPAIVDQHGFPAGDRVLALVARRLLERTPDDVTLAYLQPCRFAAVVPGGAVVAAALGEEFLATCTPVRLEPAEVPLRACAGVSDAGAARAAPVPVRIGRLVQEAEAACRAARTDGNGSVVFADPTLRAAQQRSRDLDTLIRTAMAEDGVQVAYQPVFDLSSMEMVGVEALLRVHDADGRPVPPREVVPAAEASGLIVGLGRQVLREAATQVARWRRDHGVLLPVAVNVSAVQLGRDTFVSDVLGAVSAAGIPPEALSLELTESVLLASGSAGVTRLHQLDERGVSTAIDDFGTGYASLSYLKDLPAAALKIDRSFVEGIPADHGAMAIVASVIGLAENFGLSRIAEGIETQAQLDYLAGRGILGQGFLLGRPVDAGAIGELLHERLRRHPATGAPHRPPGLAELSRELTRCSREGHDLLLVMMQVDGADGHRGAGPRGGAGPSQKKLHAAAAAVRGGLRSYDLVLLYDDSTVLCALTMLDLDSACARLRAISEAVAGGDPHGSLIFGAAALAPGDTVDTLMARAGADLHVRRRSQHATDLRASRLQLVQPPL